MYVCVRMFVSALEISIYRLKSNVVRLFEKWRVSLCSVNRMSLSLLFLLHFGFGTGGIRLGIFHNIIHQSQNRTYFKGYA